MHRIRVKATIDQDAASPDSINAANEYLTRQIEERAMSARLAIDWGTWRSYARRDRHGDLLLIQWAKVI